LLCGTCAVVADLSEKCAVLAAAGAQPREFVDAGLEGD